MAFKKRNKEGILFGAYSPFLMTQISEEHVKAVAESGVHYAIIGFGNAVDFPVEKRLEVLGWCEKYDIEAILSDRFDKEKAEDADWYASLPNFAGQCLADEPLADECEALGQKVRDYMEIFPGKIPYINLFPLYAGHFGVWGDGPECYEASDALYQKYLDEYIEKVPTDYICFDTYPCEHKNGIKEAYYRYVRNIELVSDSCKKSGREFWMCIQSCAYKAWEPRLMRIPDEDDMRWQIYTMMSFGVKKYMYYLFVGNEYHFGAPIDKDGNKTPLWYACKKITDELDNFSSVFAKYKNLGAYSHNNSDSTPYLNMRNPYKGFHRIPEIICDSPLLIGCFEEKDGKGNAFTVVNMSDMALDKKIEAKFRINGKKVTAYFGGEPIVLAPVDGYYEVSLECGNGVFVTID